MVVLALYPDILYSLSFSQMSRSVSIELFNLWFTILWYLPGVMSRLASGRQVHLDFSHVPSVL